MKVLDSGPDAGPARFASRVVHDEPNVRVIAFHLLPGQTIPPHTSDSTVVVQVVEGEGLFRGEDGEVRLTPGMGVVYAPRELHSMEPLDGQLRFHALLTPGPT